MREFGDVADNQQGQLLVQVPYTMIFKQFRERITREGQEFDPKEFMSFA